MNMGARSTRLTAFGVFIFALLFFASGAYALPQDGQFAAGQGSISTPAQNEMEVIQSTEKAIIDWQRFGIDPAEAVRFTQPGSSSVILNRVIGLDPSVIQGLLTGNGHIFLTNPNGVIIGEGAVIDVGSFLATTLRISNEDFMAGNYSFLQDPGKPLSYVINEGLIKTAEGGYTVLAAPHVANYGRITASLGSVHLAAGEEAFLSLTPDGLIGFSVDGPLTGEVEGPDGTLVETNVLNAGEITVDGGTVVLEAKTAYDTVRSVVNNEGIIEAKAVYDDGGTIVLLGEGGITENSGVLDASGKGAGQTGGTVQVLGRYAGLQEGSSIDVSGSAGGGEALVGGDYQGTGDVPTAERTFIAKTASINADAIDSGNGGKVIAWADEYIKYYGSISARGGAQGGDGGFAEVSGKKGFTFEGGVDLAAPNGEAGTFLLDPTNIEVVDGGGSLYNAVNAYSAGGATEQISPSTLDSVGSIWLYAHDNITVTSPLILTTAGASMTFNAGDDIILNNNITTNNGNITLVANDAGGSEANKGTPGAITMCPTCGIDAGTFTTIDLSAQGDITLTGISSNSALITSTDGGIVDAGDSMVDISSLDVVLNAATGIGSANGLETHISNLKASNTGSGDVNINNTLHIVIYNISNSGGGFNLLSTGHIVIGTVSAAGPVTMKARWDISTFHSSSSPLLLISSGGDITLQADYDNSGIGMFFMDRGNYLDAGTGTVTISATENVTISGIFTSSSSGSAVSVTSRSGGIFDGGDIVYPDISAPDGGVVLSALTGIGALEIDAASVTMNIGPPTAPDAGTGSPASSTVVEQAQDRYTDPAPDTDAERATSEQGRPHAALGADDAEYYSDLCALYQERGEKEIAVKYCLIAASKASGDAEAHLNLGNAYMRRDNLDRAIEQYRAATELSPDYADAHEQLAGAYRQKGLNELADEHSRIAEGLRQKERIEQDRNRKDNKRGTTL